MFAVKGLHASLRECQPEHGVFFFFNLPEQCGNGCQPNENPFLSGSKNAVENLWWHIAILVALGVA